MLSRFERRVETRLVVVDAVSGREVKDVSDGFVKFNVDDGIGEFALE